MGKDYKIIEEHNFETWESFQKFISPKRSPHFGFGGYVFRGLPSDTYKLIPSIQRNDFYGHKKFLGDVDSFSSKPISLFKEIERIQHFYKLADENGLQIPNIPEFEFHQLHYIEDYIKKWKNWVPYSLYELISIAQHYGTPTRFLDWSFDIKTAIYFAVTGNINNDVIFEKDGKIVIWMINYAGLSVIKDGLTFKSSTLELPIEFIKPPYYTNKHLFMQRGLFSQWRTKLLDINTDLNHKPLNELLEDFFVEYSKDYNLEDMAFAIPFMYKITLNKKNLINAFGYLQRNNYLATKHFDGWEGVSKELKETDFFLKYAASKIDVSITKL